MRRGLCNVFAKYKLQNSLFCLENQGSSYPVLQKYVCFQKYEIGPSLQTQLLLSILYCTFRGFIAPFRSRQGFSDFLIIQIFSMHPNQNTRASDIGQHNMVTDINFSDFLIIQIFNMHSNQNTKASDIGQQNMVGDINFSNFLIIQIISMHSNQKPRRSTSTTKAPKADQ